MLRQFDRRVAAPLSLKMIYGVLPIAAKNGHTLVVFQPEKRVLEALKLGLSALVLRETNKKTQ